MSGNKLGKIFTLTSFGESHGKAIGGIIEGCPAGLAINMEFIQKELDKRRPGQSSITTQRKESDVIEVLSGIHEGQTTGTPIGFIIANKDSKSKDYDHLKDSFRPSHADYTYQEKYGIRDHRGGGRASARETAVRVAAGAFAQLLLKNVGITIRSFVDSVGSVKMENALQEWKKEMIYSNIVRCPDPKTASEMLVLIEKIRKEGDSIGGTITTIVNATPAGLGEPVFDKLHADLGKAMLSINAAKGFEIGSGFRASEMKGSEHNDVFINAEEKVRTKTNYSGGIQGGISNGENIYFRVAFKPVATIMRDQQSIDKDKKETTVKGKGRHDPCVVPRAVPIVEAMTALVLADHFLRNKTAKI